MHSEAKQLYLRTSSGVKGSRGCLKAVGTCLGVSCVFVAVLGTKSTVDEVPSGLIVVMSDKCGVWVKKVLAPLIYIPNSRQVMARGQNVFLVKIERRR